MDRGVGMIFFMGGGGGGGINGDSNFFGASPHSLNFWRFAPKPEFQQKNSRRAPKQKSIKVSAKQKVSTMPLKKFKAD